MSNAASDTPDTTNTPEDENSSSLSAVATVETEPVASDPIPATTVTDPAVSLSVDEIEPVPIFSANFLFDFD